jgi:hypothetical protein
MTARKLDKSQWRTFFDRPSKTLEGKQAEIELPRYPLAIRSRRSGCPCTRGDQVEAEWLPLHARGQGERRRGMVRK